MKRRITSLILAGLLCASLIGCAAHTHRVGTGSDEARSQEQRQWYILFGLVPLNDVDTRQMAGDDENYTITTEITPLDFVINLITQFVTVNSRTVTVDH